MRFRVEGLLQKYVCTPCSVASPKLSSVRYASGRTVTLDDESGGFFKLTNVIPAYCIVNGLRLVAATATSWMRDTCASLILAKILPLLVVVCNVSICKSELWPALGSCAGEKDGTLACILRSAASLCAKEAQFND